MKLLPLLAFTCAAAAQERSVPARVVFFEAVPRVVKVGEALELRWATVGAEKVRLDPSGEELPPQGKSIRKPTGSTVFWLFAGNDRGGQCVPLAVEVLPTVDVPQGGFWIQFAALANGDRAKQVQEELQGLGEPVRLFPVAKTPGLQLQRVRMGPFPTREAAQRRLREIRLKAKALHLNPLVVAE